MIVKVIITDVSRGLRYGVEEFLLRQHLKRHGYMRFDGTYEREYDNYLPRIIFLYTPGPRDILFKRFDKWAPPWQKTKQILFRRF